MSKANKLAGSFLLGLVGIVLLFVFGEGLSIPGDLPGAIVIHYSIGAAGIGAYFFLVAFVLCRGNQQAIRQDWPSLVALVLPLLLSTVIALIVESQKAAALEPAGATLLALTCSWGGAATAVRAARRRAVPIARPN